MKRTKAKGAQFVTAQQNPAMAIIVEAPPTEVANQVASNKVEKIPFESVHKSDSDNQDSGSFGVKGSIRLTKSFQAEGKGG